MTFWKPRDRSAFVVKYGQNLRICLVVVIRHKDGR